jgi:peptidoglycan/xylan/chitin deacetylase (PgdA/CDA1 family)
MKFSILLINVLFIVYCTLFVFQKRVPMLCFHQIGDHFTETQYLAKSTDFFSSLLDELQDQDYRFILPGEKSALNDKVLILSFDDGTNDHFEYVMDYLHKRQIPAVFFWTGENLQKITPEQKKLLRERAKHHLIGSHTNGSSHLLSKKFTSSADIKNELTASKKNLQDFFGREITLFAYPEGEYNREIHKIALQQYQLNFSIDYDYFYPEKPNHIHGRYMLLPESNIADVTEYLYAAKPWQSKEFIISVCLILFLNILFFIRQLQNQN